MPQYEANSVLSTQEYRVVGKRPVRHDGADKVTGKARYGADMVLPGMTFGVPVGKRDEYAERMWQWDEIQRQGARMEVVESWKERQAAIRERRDRERAARPDTIRGGR